RGAAGNFQAVVGSTNWRWNEPAVGMVSAWKSGSSGNWSRYNNPAVDTALNELSTVTDKARKVELVHTVEKAVLQDSPVAWYARFVNVTATAKRVQNWKTYFDNYPLLDSVWVKPTK